MVVVNASTSFMTKKSPPGPQKSIWDKDGSSSNLRKMGRDDVSGEPTKSRAATRDTVTHLYSLLAKTQLGVVSSPFALSTVSSCASLGSSMGLVSKRYCMGEFCCARRLDVASGRERNEEVEEDLEGDDCDSEWAKGESLAELEGTAGGNLGDRESRKESMAAMKLCGAKSGTEDDTQSECANGIGGVFGCCGRSCCEGSMVENVRMEGGEQL